MSELQTGDLSVGQLDMFGYGVRTMARSCQDAMKLVRRGQWTLDQVEEWLAAVLTDDATVLEQVKMELQRMSE